MDSNDNADLPPSSNLLDDLLGLNENLPWTVPPDAMPAPEAAMKEKVKTKPKGTGKPRGKKAAGLSVETKPGTTQSNRHKEEIKFLEQKVKTLNETLTQLRTKRQLKDIGASPWEMEARAQTLKTQKVVQDNTTLRKAVEEQLEYAKMVEKVIKRQPRLELSEKQSIISPRSLRLGADLHQRPIQMHSIMDQARDKMSSVLIDTGLHNLTTAMDMMRINDKNATSEDIDEPLVIEVAKHFKYTGVRYDDIANTFFDFYSGGFGPFSAGDLSIEPLDRTDENLRYMRFTSTSLAPIGGNLTMKNCIVKRYTEGDRMVVIWKSISNDDVFQVPKDQFKGDSVGWLITEKIDPPPNSGAQDASSVKLICQLTPLFEDENGNKANPPGVLSETLMNCLMANTNAIKQMVETIMSSQTAVSASQLLRE